MIKNIKRTAAIFGAVALTSSALVACGGDNGNGGGGDEKDPSQIEGLSGQSGQLVAEGATSQADAMNEVFGLRYQEAVEGATLAYNGTGSGQGVKNFTAGQVAFAGSDSPLKDEEVEPAKQRCNGNEAWHLPMVIGPVAIAYNLEGQDINLTIDNLVDIFKGDIKKWNDSKIADANPDASLPDKDIKVIYRAEESGTSDNFQKFLKAASNGRWDSTGKSFPKAVGAGANKSTGVVKEVEKIDGAITYVEVGAAQASGLQIANIDFGAGPVELNKDSVVKALDNLEFKEGHNEHDLVVDSEALFKQNGEGAYPLILTTYEIVCSAGYDEATGKQVKDFLKVALESQNQTLEDVGYIPVEGKHLERLKAAVDALA
ncbi:phosphate ABC transporter substrate-binding protein PstS [Corynebacterium aquatimens]|uniref:Phosphate-binding protein n=1 Tax=Corynebacterium aquatimens TaxID=1190508 RepID=A0A931E1X6_9CORY|nr:phosphate ABC transporter substrate-binding protein PstS [Corynebacterium aquatimens]MBG6122286.1 phosphate transport system substrate-binding protein [Corynebacterium aquatimens]WJY65173.1 Phosphate-binding protein PstS 3 precursor [Corynebacterium aquatimens]